MQNQWYSFRKGSSKSLSWWLLQQPKQDICRMSRWVKDWGNTWNYRGADWPQWMLKLEMCLSATCLNLDSKRRYLKIFWVQPKIFVQSLIPSSFSHVLRGKKWSALGSTSEFFQYSMWKVPNQLIIYIIIKWLSSHKYTSFKTVVSLLLLLLYDKIYIVYARLFIPKNMTLCSKIFWIFQKKWKSSVVIFQGQT